MPKEAVFTLKLETELRDAFMAEAEAVDRPASQVVRELMREFVHKQQETRSYEDFVRAKIARARASFERDGGIPDEEVRAKFAERKARARAQLA